MLRKGSYSLPTLRAGCWRYLRQTSPLLAARLEKVYNIWSDDDYARYASSSRSAGIFLNLHKHEATREAKSRKVRVGGRLANPFIKSNFIKI